MKDTSDTAGSSLVAVLVTIAAGIGVIGVAYTPPATIGVGLIAFAVLLAVFARIAQARAQHAHLVKHVK